MMLMMLMMLAVRGMGENGGSNTDCRGGGKEERSGIMSDRRLLSLPLLPLQHQETSPPPPPLVLPSVSVLISLPLALLAGCQQWGGRGLERIDLVDLLVALIDSPYSVKFLMTARPSTWLRLTTG